MSGRPITYIPEHWIHFRSLTIWLRHEQLQSHTKKFQTTKNYKDSCGIQGLENISNPFKIVDIMDLPNFTEIWSISSIQARAKNAKFSLSCNPKFPSKEQQPTSSGDSTYQSENEAAIKSSLKWQQKKPVKNSNSLATKMSSFYRNLHLIWNQQFNNVFRKLIRKIGK